MPMEPYDQRLARALVRPLVSTWIRPNHITTLNLLLGILSAYLFASATPYSEHVAALLFVSARFLDHCDGELARAQGTTSDFGDKYDFFVSTVSYAGLFIAIGIGLGHGALGGWAYALIGAGVMAGALNTVLRLDLSSLGGGFLPEHPTYGGFELEDGIYLLAPITWLGLLSLFFVLAAGAACVFVLWTARNLNFPGGGSGISGTK